MREIIAALCAAMLAWPAFATPIEPSSDPKYATAAVATQSASSLVVKAAPGNLYDAYATNNTGSTVFVYVFNRVTAPSNGSVTAGTASGNYQDCIAVPTGQTISVIVAGSPPEPFSVGVVLAASSTSCGTLTLATVDFMKARVQ